MKTLITLLLVSILSSCASIDNDKHHLFILSGQSNMARLDPTISFTPMLNAKFGAENVVVVKDTQGAQPISRWVNNWQSQDGSSPEVSGDLYDRLMTKVKEALPYKPFSTVTFIWMQGERDARKRHGDVYIKSFKTLVSQLSSDLNRNDINVVIGRLSDFDLNNNKYPHWTLVRQAQEQLAIELPQASWVNSDDLNDGINNKGKVIKNDLHMSVDGYKKLGERFANESIKLIQQFN